MDFAGVDYTIDCSCWAGSAFGPYNARVVEALEVRHSSIFKYEGPDHRNSVCKNSLNSITPGLVGGHLSHAGVWRESLEKARLGELDWVMILEDDAVPDPRLGLDWSSVWDLVAHHILDLRRRGEPWDILYGPKHDLLNVRNQRRVLALLSSRHVLVDWWGTPCTSLSLARKFDGLGPAPLRDPDDPTQPAVWTSVSEKVIVEQANALIEITVRGIRAGFKAGAVCVLENPEGSRLWELPSVSEVLKEIGAQHVVTHYCRWLERDEVLGELPWLKPTRLSGTLPGLLQLARQCSRTRFCREWGCNHRPLVGKTADGRFWTAVAQPYPRRLCAAVASLIGDYMAR